MHSLLVPVVLAITLVCSTAFAAPMLYTFSGNSGVLVDDLGLGAAAGLAPTGQVSYQFVVDSDRASITTDWTGAVFEYGGAVGDRRFYATLVSRPYLVSAPTKPPIIPHTARTRKKSKTSRFMGCRFKSEGSDAWMLCGIAVAWPACRCGVPLD